MRFMLDVGRLGIFFVLWPCYDALTDQMALPCFRVRWGNRCVYRLGGGWKPA